MRPQRHDRIDDEIAFHIEQQTAKNVRAGMTAEDARRAALLKFGGVERRARPRATRCAAPGCATSPATCGSAFRSLAPHAVVLGQRPFSRSASALGAAVAMFSVVNAVLLRPLPYPDADRIVRLFQSERARQAGGNVSGPNFFDWRTDARLLAMARRSNGGCPRRSPASASRAACRRPRVAGVLRRLGYAPGCAAAASCAEELQRQRPDGRGGRCRLLGPMASGRGRSPARRSCSTASTRRRRHHAAPVRLPAQAEMWMPRSRSGRSTVADRAQLPRRRAREAGVASRPRPRS